MEAAEEISPGSCGQLNGESAARKTPWFKFDAARLRSAEYMPMQKRLPSKGEIPNTGWRMKFCRAMLRASFSVMLRGGRVGCSNGKLSTEERSFPARPPHWCGCLTRTRMGAHSTAKR